MKEIVAKEIDGITYLFDYLPATKAVRLEAVIVKALLAPAGQLLAGALEAYKDVKAGASLFDLDLSKLDVGNAFEKLANHLDPDELQQIIVELMSKVSLEPGAEAKERGRLALNVDQDFKGNTKHLLKVAAQSFEVNFGDFFDGVRGLGEIGKTFLSTLVKAPSAGRSGESSSPEQLPSPK